MKKRFLTPNASFFILFLIFNLFFCLKFANASEYQLPTLENKNFTEYTQNSYNEIGTLKIGKSSDENFDTAQNVVVTVQYDGKLVNQNDPVQTLSYDLILGGVI